MVTAAPFEGNGARLTRGHPFLAGFDIGIANPITLLWFLTVGGALITTQAGGRMGGLTVAFGVSFILGVLCWDTVVAALAGAGVEFRDDGPDGKSEGHADQPAADDDFSHEMP